MSIVENKGVVYQPNRIRIIMHKRLTKMQQWEGTQIWKEKESQFSNSRKTARKKPHGNIIRQIKYFYDSQIAKVTIEKKFLQLLQERYASPNTFQDKSDSITRVVYLTNFKIAEQIFFS